MQVTEFVISIGFLDTAKYVNIIFLEKKVQYCQFVLLGKLFNFQKNVFRPFLC
jgi:hypothetical protein